MRYLRSVLAAVAATALAAGPLPWASASALLAPTYKSSDPAKGEMMDHPPSEVTVTFSEPLDQSSWMNVYDECGNEIDSGPATVELTEMTVGVGKTPQGTYEVVYKAVGLAGATGSSTSTFEFMVHHGKPCGGKKKGDDHHHPPGKDKDKNGHDDHDEGRSGSGHDDHDDDAGDSNHSGHSGTRAGSSGHSGHDMGSMGSSNQHGAGHGKGHGNHGSGGGEAPRTGNGSGDTTLAGGAGDVPVTADAEAALIGLGLALMVGVLGGWLLRMSGNLSKPA